MKVGIVGAGAFASRVLIPGLRLAPGCEVVAVCDRDEAAAASAAASFGIPNVHTDSSEMLARAHKLGLDLLVVGAPPSAHEPLVSAGLDCGLHVFCEKPLTLSSTDAEKLVNRASSLNRVNAVDHELRYSSAYRTLRKLVREGYVGEVRQVNLSITADYGVNPFFEATYYWNFGSLLASGGGIIAQMLCHFIDLFSYVFDDIEPVAGYAATLMSDKPILLPPLEPGGHKREGPRRPVDADDSVTLVGMLPNLAPATICANWITPGMSGARWEIRGSEGSLIYQATDPLFGGAITGWRVDAPQAAVLPLEPEYPVQWPEGKPGSYASAMIAHTASELAAAIAGRPGERHFATFASELEVWRRMERWRDLIAVRRAPSAKTVDMPLHA
nr:Gfo/Idh/MocA family oxidoreductase [Sphingomonas sp. CDS-1]